jgi:hypothetical protein
MTDSSRNFTASGIDYALPWTSPNDGIPTLPQSMTAAAFLGIAWFICAEVNVRLLLRATRRSLYFWAGILYSWGITIHGVAILLDNFQVWNNVGSLVVIELSC